MKLLIVNSALPHGASARIIWSAQFARYIVELDLHPDDSIVTAYMGSLKQCYKILSTCIRYYRNRASSLNRIHFGRMTN